MTQSEVRAYKYILDELAGKKGWDKGQIATQQTAYGSGKLALLYPFFENKGFIFQGYVDDSSAALEVNTRMKAGATGEFILQSTSGIQVRSYAETIYYIADTGAVWAKPLVFRESNMLGQGTSEV